MKDGEILEWEIVAIDRALNAKLKGDVLLQLPSGYEVVEEPYLDIHNLSRRMSSVAFSTPQSSSFDGSPPFSVGNTVT